MRSAAGRRWWDRGLCTERCQQVAVCFVPPAWLRDPVDPSGVTSKDRHSGTGTVYCWSPGARGMGVIPAGLCSGSGSVGPRVLVELDAGKGERVRRCGSRCGSRCVMALSSSRLRQWEGSSGLCRSLKRWWLGTSLHGWWHWGPRESSGLACPLHHSHVSATAAGELVVLLAVPVGAGRLLPHLVARQTLASIRQEPLDTLCTTAGHTGSPIFPAPQSEALPGSERQIPLLRSRSLWLPLPAIPVQLLWPWPGRCRSRTLSMGEPLPVLPILLQVGPVSPQPPPLHPRGIAA